MFDKKKKNIYDVPKNTVRVIMNDDGNIQEKDFPIDGCPFIEPDCPEEVHAIEPIDPFIPYAVEIDSKNKNIEKASLYTNNNGTITAVYEDETFDELRRPCFVGSKTQCYGIFIPLNVSKSSMESFKETFLDGLGETEDYKKIR